MSEFADSVRKEWGHFFTIVHTEDDWIIPLLSAVDGVTADQAFWRPGGEVASIADIALHASGWLGATLQALLGLPETDNVDWPEPAATSEAAWAEIVSHLKETVADLSRALHNLSLEELYAPPAGRQSQRGTLLTNILVHNAYHAGQIVKLRQAHAVQPAAVNAGR